MGSENSDNIQNSNDTPRHKVTIKSFKLSKLEITVGQYSEYIEHNVSHQNSECARKGAFKLLDGNFGDWRRPGKKYASCINGMA
jgi:formylglycine-generating enzyme required for sulfatase activity